VGNRLLSDGTYHYQYDADGDQIARWVQSSGNAGLTAPASGDTNITIYTWDYRNRLTSVTSYANYDAYTGTGDYTRPTPEQTIAYTYDVFNRRIGEHVSGQSDATFWWVYDGQQVVLELNSDAVVVERYLPGPAVDQVLAEEDGLDAITSWLLADTRGTVRDVVEFSYNDVTQSGATYLFDHLEYGGYGQTIYESHPSDNPGFCYNGQYWDNYSGSYCCEARWYNPSTGRYESEDPTGFSAGDVNLYRYVFNDPVNLVDPTGEATAPGSGPVVPMRAGASTGYNGTIYPYNGPGFGYYFFPWNNGSDSVWWGVGKGASWVLAAVGSGGLAVKAGLGAAGAAALAKQVAVLEAALAAAQASRDWWGQNIGWMAGRTLEIAEQRCAELDTEIEQLTAAIQRLRGG
jgi:RHS repeat-associated protein